MCSGAPVKSILDGLTAFLQGIGQTNAIILGLILGGMMAVDMGGPVNKAAYTFAVGLLASNIFQLAAEDPIRILPACILGSAIAGGLSMLFGCTLRAPHGGIFVLAIPNAVGQGGLYVVAIAVDTLVTAIVAAQLKRWQPKAKPQQLSQPS